MSIRMLQLCVVFLGAGVAIADETPSSIHIAAVEESAADGSTIKVLQVNGDKVAVVTKNFIVDNTDVLQELASCRQEGTSSHVFITNRTTQLGIHLIIFYDQLYSIFLLPFDSNLSCYLLTTNCSFHFQPPSRTPHTFNNTRTTIYPAPPPIKGTRNTATLEEYESKIVANEQKALANEGIIGTMQEEIKALKTLLLGKIEEVKDNANAKVEVWIHSFNHSIP